MLADSSKKAKALETVNSFTKNWYEQTNDLRDKWYGIYLITWVFKLLNKDFNSDDNKNLVNKAYANIQAVKPRMYARKPSFQLFPRNEDDADMVDMSKDYLDWQWDSEDLDMRYDEQGDWTLTYGTHIWQLGTDVVVKGKEKKNGKNELVIDPYLARDEGGVSDVPVWEFMIDPKDKNIQSTPAVGRYRTNVLLEDLRKTGLYDQEALNAIAVSRDGGGSNIESSEKEQTQQKEGFESKKITNLPVIKELVDYYGLLEVVEGEPPVEYIITVADKAHVLRCEPSFYEDENGDPYRPFVDFHDQKNPHLFYSIGEVEQIMGLQAVYNTFIRQRIENIQKALRGKWLVQDGSLDDESALLTNTDNAIIRWNKSAKNAPSQLPVNDVTGSLFNDLARIANEINEISGITDYAKGAEGAGDSATEAALNADAANQRFNHKLKNLYGSIKKFVRMRLWQNAQFTTEEQIIRVKYGDKKKEVKIPAFPLADVDVEIEEGSAQLPNSAVEQQKAAQLAQIAFSIPDASQLSPLQQMALKKQLTALGVTNVEKLLGIKDDDEEGEDVEGMRLREVNDHIAQLTTGELPEMKKDLDHDAHLILEAQFLQSEKGQALPEEIKKLIIKHLIEHYGYSKGARQQGATTQKEETSKRPETVERISGDDSGGNGEGKGLERIESGSSRQLERVGQLPRVS